MGRAVRLGVIGLGPSWRRRYLPALAEQGARFRLAAVADPCAGRAAREARRLGVRCATAITELIDGTDVEAVLLLGSPWFRLWPLELACAAGKPALCSGTDLLTDPRLSEVAARARAAGVSVSAELRPDLAPALARARQLLDDRLGPVRLVVAESVRPDRAAVGVGLLHAVARLFGG